MLSSILRSLTSILMLCVATSALADTDTPVMNVSGSGSDYIFVYEGNDYTTYADLSALGNSIIGWTATCTSGNCTVGDVLYVSGVGGNGNDYLFLYTEDASGNVDYPVPGAWYSFETTTAAAPPTPVYGSSAPTTAQQSRMDAKIALANSGQGNTIEAYIMGDDNDINITQAGGPSFIMLGILGDNNEFEAMQNMSGGAMAYNETTIIGTNNDVELIQQGTGNKAAFIHVDGTGQNINVNQKDSGEHFVDLSVTGYDHTVGILQEGSGNKSATVVLDGSQPWNFDLTQSGASEQTYSLPHGMSDGSAVSGTCAAIGGCNLSVTQN